MIPPIPAVPALVAVVGAGTMGAGIAETFAAAGSTVYLIDPDRATREAAAGAIRAAAPPRGAGPVIPAASAADAREAGLGTGCALAIESVPENPALKVRVLAETERELSPALLCSNTSSLSIAALQAALARPERFLGMHFFQPVPRTGLVELVSAPETAPASAQAAAAIVRALGRRAIMVRDSPGFATSRLGLAIGLEAIRMVEEGVAGAEDIDVGMMLGYQHGVGPLRMTDMVGLDVRLAIAEHLAATLGPRFEPPALLREMVAAGRLGRKSGGGFFDWPAAAASPDPAPGGLSTADSSRPDLSAAALLGPGRGLAF